MNQNPPNRSRRSGINGSELPREFMTPAQRALAAAQEIVRRQAEDQLDELEKYLDSQTNVSFVIMRELDLPRYQPSLDVAIRMLGYVGCRNGIDGGRLHWYSSSRPNIDIGEFHRVRSEIESRIEAIPKNTSTEFAILWHVEGDSNVQLTYSSVSNKHWLAELSRGLAEATQEELGWYS